LFQILKGIASAFLFQIHVTFAWRIWLNKIQTLLSNIEWNDSERKQQFVLNTLRDLAPSVFCLVESTDFFLVKYPNSISSQADYGYSNPGNRRKVWLYSDEAWEDVEYGENSGLPSGRFVSGITMGFDLLAFAFPGPMRMCRQAIAIENVGKIILLFRDISVLF
jgi:hypothetical protein